LVVPGFAFLCQLTVLKIVRQLLLKAATALFYFGVTKSEPDRKHNQIKLLKHWKCWEGLQH